MKKTKKLITAGIALSLSLPLNVFANSQYKGIEKHQIVGESNELVRVLVELEKNTNRNDVLQRILQLSDTEFRRNFSNAFNGFSVTLPSKHVGKLSLIKGVKKVTRARTYRPATANSKKLTQAISAQTRYSNLGEGMVISIIDSGVDPEHKDMRTLKNPSKAKLPVSTESNQFTVKVPYGFNFADNSYNFKDMPGKSEHGIHVAGIAAASGDFDEENPDASVSGLAPEAQVLAMKVFTNNPNFPSAFDDDIIAAIEKSVEMKADIINMSLGSANGFVDDNDPVQQAINYAKEQGILVVVAAGNDGTALTEGDDTPVAENTIGANLNDIGLVGSPSTANGALSVASFENSAVLQNEAKVNSNGQTVHSFGFNIDLGTTDGTAKKLVYVNLGKETDYTDVDVTGKIALIKRGEISFVSKVNTALAHGAAGVIIFNNVDGVVNMSLSGANDGLVIGLSKAEGETLLEKLQQDPQLDLVLSNKKALYANTYQGNMSSFTSWGTTNTLDFKPEISAVGGRVYSTINNNKYRYESGTSMASPHVAGASAIVLSQLKKDLPGIENYADFVKKTLLNTAAVIVSPDKIPYTPRRQGAGLIQVEDAIKNRVLATYETVDGEAVGELKDFTTSKTFNVVLKNYGTTPATYRIVPKPVQTTHTIDSGKKNAQNFPIFEIVEKTSDATLVANQNEVTIEGNSVKSVQFTLTNNAVQDEFVEGFIQFESNDTNVPSLNFAYLGYAGDWNEEPVFEDIDAQEFQTEDKVFYYENTRLLTQLGEVVVPAGISVNAAPGTKYSYENTAISPNGDTAADVVMPQFPLLRNVQELEFNILDSNKNVVRVLSKDTHKRKTFVKQYLNSIRNREQYVVPAYLDEKWDGTIYDATTGTFKTASEGTYYYQVKAKVRENDEPHVLEFKVQVDLTKPNVEVVNVEQVASGMKIKFTVNNEQSLTYHYARLDVDGDQITATKNSEGQFEVVVPNTAIKDSVVELVVKDSAYNETVLPVNATTSRFTNSDQSKIVDVENEKARLALQLKDANTTSVKVTYTLLSDDKVVVSTTQAVDQKNVVVETLLPQQGKYSVMVEELNAENTVISTQTLDSEMYDFTAPTFTNVVAQNNGKVRATVADNLFAANALLVYVNDQKVETSIISNQFEIDVENFKTGDRLEIAQPGKNGKGLSTVVTLDYSNGATPGDILPPPPPLPPDFGKPKPLVIQFEPFVIAGLTHLKTTENQDGLVEEIDGKYYYTVKGTTSDAWTDMYIQQVKATIKKDDGTFSSKVEIKEGINNINVVGKDFDGKIVYEGSVKVFFDKSLPTLDWNNHLVFEHVDDKTYLVVPETESNVLLKGILSDKGFGYGLEINGDFVAGRSEIAKSDTYHVPFEKLIPIKNNDVITVALSDAVGNENVFKLHVKMKKVYPDLPLTSGVTKQQYEGVSIQDVISEIPEGYVVTLVENTENLDVGTHPLHVKVRYPDDSEKIFDFTLTLLENQKVDLAVENVMVKGTEQSLGKNSQLTVKLDSKTTLNEVHDTFNIQLNNQLKGKVTVQLPLDKKNFKSVYLVENDKKTLLDVKVAADTITFETEKLGVFKVVYDRVVVSYVKNDVTVVTKNAPENSDLNVVSLGNDLFDIFFLDKQTNQKLDVREGEFMVTLPKKSRNVIAVENVDQLGNVLETFTFTQNETTVTFKTTHFSLYRLVYEKTTEVVEEKKPDAANKQPSVEEKKPTPTKEETTKPITKIETPKQNQSVTPRVDTGDYTNTLLLVVLCLGSVLGLFLLRKKQK